MQMPLAIFQGALVYIHYQAYFVSKNPGGPKNPCIHVSINETKNSQKPKKDFPISNSINSR
jgi:hypothetical protein